MLQKTKFDLLLEFLGIVFVLDGSDDMIMI